jgi:serine/threonine-protein kinase
MASSKANRPGSGAPTVPSLSGKRVMTAYGAVATLDDHGQPSSGSLDPGGMLDDGSPLDLQSISLSDDAGAATGEPIDGRYRHLDLLGEGGMGTVFLCKDTRVGREVALKVIKAGGQERARQLKFVREAQVQGQLEHPAILPVYDLGSDQDGRLYLSMKRVKGRSLTEVLHGIKEGDRDICRHFTRRRLLAAFADVCLAVDFAHSKGVVHRDLKPDNIMLGDFGEVYLLDWGLAKVTDEPDLAMAGEPGDLPSLDVVNTDETVEGALRGTPGYMAPEQVRGEQGRISVRTDVYTLGAILFEIVALEPLITRNRVEPMAVLMRTVKGVDARPSVRAPDQDVPPELDKICVRACRVEPEERYPSVRNMFEDLERYLEGDRDLELRRRMAQAHADSAAQLAESITGVGEGTGAGRSAEIRRQALSEVGRSLAFDPENTRAMATLVRLLTEPPREMPPDAQREADEELSKKLVARMKIAVLGFAVWLACLPALIWLGIRSYTLLGLSLAAFGLCIAIGLYYVRTGISKSVPYPVLLATALAIGTTYPVFGPLFFLPTVATVAVMFMTLGPDPERRLQAFIIVATVMTLPVILEVAGVLPASYSFHNGFMVIRPAMLEFSPIKTQLATAFINLALVVLGYAVVARYRNLLNEADRRLHLQSWQLRQLVPAVAGKESTPQPPASGGGGGAASQTVPRPSIEGPPPGRGSRSRDA